MRLATSRRPKKQHSELHAQRGVGEELGMLRRQLQHLPQGAPRVRQPAHIPPASRCNTPLTGPLGDPAADSDERRRHQALSRRRKIVVLEVEPCNVKQPEEPLNHKLRLFELVKDVGHFLSNPNITIDLQESLLLNVTNRYA